VRGFCQDRRRVKAERNCPDAVFEKRASELKQDLQKICFTGDKAELVSPDPS